MEGQIDGAGGKKEEKSSNGFALPVPSISLPKGGGAIRGIGEKFAANPVTGTGAMSVPIATSPGRSGFGPQLSISYDSGAGNGPFGLGWNLALPAITRKTDRGLPQYHDAEESDVFILSGAEDLVPVLVQDESHWRRETIERVVGGNTYRIQRYRPRIEGLFARIERWSNLADPLDIFWRSISKENITTWYGNTDESRIADPADPIRVFSWLISESHDDKGNVIVYRYAKETSDRVDLSLAHERNRTHGARSANRYLKRIRYGNHNPYLPELAANAPWPALPGEDQWFFEVVFDYGEHDANQPLPDESRTVWPPRNDPFSSYRSGFEVRTYRLCQRVLMFHHFPGEQHVGANCLVRSTDFTYFDEQDPASAQNPIFSQLQSVTQTSYQREEGDGYRPKSLPPLEFEYSRVPSPQQLADQVVRQVGPESLENLPVGLDNGRYHWVDLDGEGLSGVLTEQAAGWFYKRNLSPLNLSVDDLGETLVRFGPIERVAEKPSLAAISGGRQQFLDLAGDGQLDLVDLEGPTPGFYERTADEGWERFEAFESLPVVDWGNPNLKFVDLTGDGHADILISEDEVFCWHPSLAEAGFGPPERIRKLLDEEKEPQLVFADGTQSIYLADMSGDGLTDLIRIRNGEVCYWPNLGYCRFGPKVTMDGAPWFDFPDLFDQKRIHLADVDGSGVTDILYLRDDGIQIYFNQSGNAWSPACRLNLLPPVDNLSNVAVVDLLGNGTACLVWSSPLPAHGDRPMSYVDLMGNRKPHLLVKVVNNLGAETHVDYAPSTQFYLQDKLEGNPWITRLPFPVHCVQKVTVTDKWRNTRFATTYSYHHGYFDGPEREFRGFGRVEQVDVESYGVFEQGNAASPYITSDKTLYQPPVKTVTWYHTGALLDRERILSQFAHEYFPQGFLSRQPGTKKILGDFQENALPEPDLVGGDFNSQEWREALRACKGTMLRQEVYELDVDALERGEHRPVRLFSTAYHNCHIRRLQAQTGNRHAVFLVTESEAITYHYEMDLRQETLQADPRIAHTLNLKFNDYAQPLQAVAVVYPRRGRYDASALDGADLSLIHSVQRERHLGYTESRYTDDVNQADSYRLRVPCEVLTYELTVPDSRDDRFFTLAELRRYWLSLVHQDAGEEVTEIAYHNPPTRKELEKRLVEHVRMLFFKDDPADPEALKDPLPFGQLGRLGLAYETYKLALTEDLLAAVFDAKLDADVRSKLSDAGVSGYLSGSPLAERFHGAKTTGQYWIRSGIAGFAADAPQNFYLPERYTDPFDNVTRLEYDRRALFVQSSTDALDNKTEVTRFDFRVLAPREMKDINDNLSEVCFDVLGLPTAMAMKGKGQGDEGDRLDDFIDAVVNPDLAMLTKFFADEQPYDEAQARRWLGDATARHVYYFGETLDATGAITWGAHPACACGIVREQHVAGSANGEQSLLQAVFEYSDGTGSVVVKKIQAEPEAEGKPLRWIANGKTILNNKGKPVKQYEPYFSASGHRYEEPKEEGVTPIIYYDAAGRTVRTESPDGSFSRVEFSPWHVATYDANDTVLESGNPWFARKSAGTAEEKRAVQLASEHADTPTVTILDSLGREVISIAHNRFKNAAGGLTDEKYLTFTKLDAEGKPLWIRDARRNLVMQYIRPVKPTRAADEPDPRNAEQLPSASAPCYDIAGNLLYQHSMDAGDRWMLHDAAGKPMLAWDFNERRDEAGTVKAENRLYFTQYDALHRPVANWLRINGEATQLIERFDYLDTRNEPAGTSERNLRGQLHKHYDASGLKQLEKLDFKGNLLEQRRQLAKAVKAPVIDWQDGSPTALLEEETFVQITEYDALNRMTRLYNWHRLIESSRVVVYEPRYSPRGLLAGETLIVRAEKTTTGFSQNAQSRKTDAIQFIEYSAKGQKERIRYGNGTTTRYLYDEETFRLRQLRTTRPDVDPAFPSPPSGLKDDRVLQNLYYTYDPVGNVTEILDDAFEPVYFRNQQVNAVNRYIYDALYRLIEASGRESAEASGPPPQIGKSCKRLDFPEVLPGALRNYTQIYSYDAVGNITRIQHQAGNPGSWTRNYTHADDSNRLSTTLVGGDPADTIRYRHDPHGNMLNVANKSPAQDIHWDYRDMIHFLDLEGGGFAYYNYDAGKQRTRKRLERIGNLVEERIDLGGLEIYRKFASGALVEEIESIHLFEGQQRIMLIDDVLQTDNAQLRTGPLYRYQYGNHLGSVGAELDDRARIISYEEYHPYGTTAYCAIRKEVDTPKRYRYTGKERDEEMGLYYQSARYYAPWLGRWGSCDPIEVGDGHNIYLYGHCNPIKNVDPLGAECVDVIGWGKPGEDTLIHGCPANETSRVPKASLSGPSSIKPSAPPSKKTAPVPKQTTKSVPDNSAANKSLREKLAQSQLIQGALGFAIGVGAANIPFIGPVILPAAVASEAVAKPTKTMEWWYGAGQTIAGVMQIVGGFASIAVGSEVAAGGGIGSVFSGGASLAIAGVGITGVAAGFAMVGTGALSLGSGFSIMKHAADRTDDDLPEGTHKVVDDPNADLTDTRTPSQALGDALEEINEFKPGNDYEAHHIVAWNDPRAAEAKRILEIAGIDINSSANGVWLRRATTSTPRGSVTSAFTEHGTLHTNEYFRYVNEQLGKVDPNNTQAVLGVLNDLKAKLLLGH